MVKKAGTKTTTVKKAVKKKSVAKTVKPKKVEEVEVKKEEPQLTAVNKEEVNEYLDSLMNEKLASAGIETTNKEVEEDVNAEVDEAKVLENLFSTTEEVEVPLAFQGVFNTLTRMYESYENNFSRVFYKGNGVFNIFIPSFCDVDRELGRIQFEIGSVFTYSVEETDDGHIIVASYK